MKTLQTLVPLLFAAICTSAIAAADHGYYVTELASQQRFDVYNDGRNTFLESVPGLIVSGAIADGDTFIVHGVPSTIHGYFNGKPITIVRGAPPAVKPVPPDPAVVDAKLKKLTDELAALTAKANPQGAQGAGTPATAAAPIRPVAVPGAAPGHPTINDQLTWAVTPADQTLRQLVDRFAKTVGWTSQWDVDKDILINFSDEKSNDFKSAVRRVLASTEFGDLKVKPCFYSNAVVRVVPKTTKCNPNE